VKFDASPAAAGPIRCPICDTRFAAAAMVRPSKLVPPAVPAPAPAPVRAPAAAALAAPSSRGGGRLVAVALILLVLLGIAGGLGYALVQLDAGGQRPPDSAPLADRVIPDRAMPATTAHVPPATQPAANPDRSLPPELQTRVNQAIDRGVVRLRSQLSDLVEAAASPPAPFNGSTNRPDLLGPHYLGVVALQAWTLLYCDAPADDPLVRKTADILRARSDQILLTYDVALAILFLEHLGDRRDHELIKSLALRLVAGQRPAGNWSYRCPLLTPPEEQQLLGLLQSVALAQSGEADLELKPDAKLALPDKLKSVAVAQRLENKQHPLTQGDNSNTQFAVVALWVAKRHGLPLQPALALLDRFYRSTQHADGSWSYTVKSVQQWRDSMTCAGLLALAMTRSLGMQPGTAGTGAGQEPPKDVAITRGLLYLGPTIATTRRGGQGRVFGADSRGDYYYLWSLERVAMIYDLRLIGGRDWYPWAAEVIVNEQKANGEWSDLHGPADSCFALLVLRRVNVATDLTADIKKLIRAEERQSPAPKKE
jgi:hypothetical protein